MLTIIWTARAFGAGLYTTQICAGAGHTCARLSDGTVRCWGANLAGALGNNSTDDSPTPVLVSGLTNVVSLACGDLHTCAALSDGTARCWGSNSDGQIGDSSNTDRHTPTVVGGLSNVTAIAAGAMHTCARLSDSSLRCWGNNSNRQLGDGNTGNPKDQQSPVQVMGISTAVGVACGDVHSCALLANGTVSCFGANADGQLGNGDPTGTGDDSGIPVPVTGLTGVTALSSGSLHNCALVSGGGVQCWGSNASGAAGGIENETKFTVPHAVTGLPNVSVLRVGYAHNFASSSDGSVFGWGSDVFGELCDGAADTSTPVPRAVADLQGAVGFGPASAHSCALRANGVVLCCGENQHGEVGIGSIDPPLSPPRPTGTVAGLPILAASAPAADLLTLTSLGLLLLAVGARRLRKA